MDDILGELFTQIEIIHEFITQDLYGKSSTFERILNLPKLSCELLLEQYVVFVFLFKHEYNNYYKVMLIQNK